MLTLGDRSAAVVTATLELFHLYAEEAGWILEVTLDGGDRIALEGRARTPVLPGPSRLVLWYVDAPRVVTLADEHGMLGVPGRERPTDDGPHAPDAAALLDESAPALACTALGAGRAHLAGTLALAWTPLGGGPVRPFAIALELDAALIT